MTTRVIDPWRVFHAFGTWYVAAWCHRAEAERLFRVDRVRAVRATGEHFDPESRTDDDARDLVYRPRPDDPRVTLRLAPAADWVVESYPHESASQARDGSWKVVLAVSEPAWLERLLAGARSRRPGGRRPPIWSPSARTPPPGSAVRYEES